MSRSSRRSSSLAILALASALAWGCGSGEPADGTEPGTGGLAEDTESSSAEPGASASAGSSGADPGSSAGDESGAPDDTGAPGETGDDPVPGCVNGVDLSSTQHDYLGAVEDCELVAELYEDHFSTAEPRRIIHVAPPSGSADGVGSKDDPRRDLKSALEAAEPGDHFHLAPGVYPMNEVRDAFGHAGSLVFLSADGTREDKIVVRTDPDLYDPAAGQVATIDFEFGNAWPNHRRFSFSLSGSHWILQGLELRNFEANGIWVSGTHNLIRDNEIHHANHDGTNNFGLVVAATSGPSYNLVMGNHLHHSGGLDGAGNLVDLGGSNGGCTYSETRQGYDSDLEGIDASSTWDEFADAKDAPDSEFYFYNNVVHHCHNGIATKNNSEGPFYILSNVISDAENGIKITLSHSVVRNNIVFRDEFLGVGILVGWSAGSGWFSQLVHGVNITVSNNTIVGAGEGTSHYTGWNLVLQDNAFLDVGTAHHLRRNTYDWYGSSWPGVVGEWVYGDLSPEHPYYEWMPQALQDRAGHYHRVDATGNVYPSEPALTVGVEGDLYDLAGTTFSDDHVIVDSATLEEHMRDPAAGDYRRNDGDPGPLAAAGSGMR